MYIVDNDSVISSYNPRCYNSAPLMSGTNDETEIRKGVPQGRPQGRPRRTMVSTRIDEKNPLPQSVSPMIQDSATSNLDPHTYNSSAVQGSYSANSRTLPYCRPSTSRAEMNLSEEGNNDDDIIFLEDLPRETDAVMKNRKRNIEGSDSTLTLRKKKPRRQQIPSPKVEERAVVVDISEMFQTTPPEKTYSKNLKMLTSTRQLFFTPKASEFDGPFEDLLDMTVEGLFKEASHGRQDTDFFGIEFWWPGMPDAKYIPFRPIRSFDPAAVRLEMNTLMQSGSPNLKLTQKGRISFIMVENTLVGSGRAAHDGGPSEGSNITPVSGNDLCLPKALVLGRAYNLTGSTGKEFKSLRRSTNILETAALKLMKDAGVQKRSDYGIAELELFQDVLPDYQIKVIRDGGNLHPVWQGPYKGNGDKDIIALRLKNRHFDHIKRLASFFKNIYYCNACDKCFSNLEDHYICSVRCKRCCHYDTRDCAGNATIVCIDCQMSFETQECFNRHRVPFAGDKGVKSACTENRMCPFCNVPIYNRTGTRGKHECGKPYCRTCCEKRPKDHNDCYQRPLAEAPEDFEARTIFFDVESTFEEERNGKIYHKPNLVVAFKCCRKCWKNTPATSDDVPATCSICHDDRLKIWHSFDDSTVDPIACLVDWLEEEQHLEYTLVAHNFKGYDGHFALRQILSTTDEFVDCTYTDCPIVAGRKIMSAKIGRTRAVDSHNFIPCPLSAFTKMFELGERKKGYFPFLFNLEKNYDYDGPLPPLESYGLESLSSSKKAALTKWHSERAVAGDLFNFRREIIDYCFSDVMLLAEGCIKFSEDFFENGGVWPLHECLTAASTALKCYRRRFMKKDTMLADRPSNLKRRQSALALKFFEWKRHAENVIIQDALHGGERRLGTHYLDGFIENGGRGIALEVKGCYFHQHECRYTEDSLMRGKSARRIRREDAEREAIIREHYDLEIYWECDIERMLRSNKDMADFFEQLHIYDPINLRFALCGGRVEAYILQCEVELESHMKIMYYDFCSLYPNVNKYREYPCGGQKTLSKDDLRKKTNTPDGRPVFISTTQQLNETVKGFLFCKVQPPRRLHLPALPAHLKNKLLFTLCTRCVAENNKGFCKHDVDERTITGTWATVELELALQRGYVIVDCYEAIHYDQWTVYEKDETTGEVLQHGLYSEYMDTFIKLKAQASGWPAGVETEEQKDAYLLHFLKEEGVRLEKSKVVKNGPARAGSKLGLNSLWGKSAENPIRTKTLITSNHDDFIKIISKPGVKIQSLCALGRSDRIELKYQEESDAIEPLSSNSLAVGCLTTAYARVQLYSALERIQPDRLLYADTDSIIFLHDTREENPLADMMGDTLGRLTDELPEGSRCVGYVSQGPKVYALRILNEANGETTETVKCRGFALTAESENHVNYEKIRDHVKTLINDTPEDPVPVRYFKISTDREHSVYSHHEIRMFRPTYDKRVILPDGSTRPYGWCED